MFPTPHLIVVTPWAHFVLHLIPFERGHWRIAGEAGERSGGAAGEAERHTNKKKKKIAPQGEIASTAAGLWRRCILTIHFPQWPSTRLREEPL